MHPRIVDLIKESISVKEQILREEILLSTVDKVIALVVETFRRDRKVLFCGNGGSAADAQHIASELSGRFYLDRAPLFAEALHVNTSALTAIGNDYGFEEIYARMVEAKGRKGDILFTLSTSGNSPNILRAIESARQQEMLIIGMTGQTGGAMQKLCDYLINIPSTDTPRIQECHMMIGHLICEVVEKQLFE
jgi:D-sedoheptulose 7-phosphate isomerase